MSRNISTSDSGITVTRDSEEGLYLWFLASFLFGARIGQTTAANTWRALVEQHGLDTPQKLCDASHQQLVKIMGEGGYTRYDESTSRRLSLLCRNLLEEYDGRILGVFEAADSRADFERRLRSFKGVGPVTVRIFMREGKRLFKD